MQRLVYRKLMDNWGDKFSNLSLSQDSRLHREYRDRKDNRSSECNPTVRRQWPANGSNGCLSQIFILFSEGMKE
jgi:hypothetical protein